MLLVLVLYFVGTCRASCDVPAQFNPFIEPSQDPIISPALAAFATAVQEHSQQVVGGLSVGLVYGQRLFWTRGYGLINASDPARGAPNEGASASVCRAFFI
jgi:hypothetical protein